MRARWHHIFQELNSTQNCRNFPLNKLHVSPAHIGILQFRTDLQISGVGIGYKFLKYSVGIHI